MNVDFVLNGDSVRVDTDPETRLVNTLREELGLVQTRAGCYEGSCGTCAVLIDGELVHSCLVPVFSVRTREVTTIEGITGTITYRDIIRGFDAVGYRPCRVCRQAKVLALYRLFESRESPTKAEIDEIALAQRCRCTTYEELTALVSDVTERRRSRRSAGVR